MLWHNSVRNHQVCIHYCWFMSIIRGALRNTLPTRCKGSTLPQTDTGAKICHSISIALVTGQGRERCEIAGCWVTPCLLPLKTTTPGHFYRSVWLPVSPSPQLSFRGCKPCLERLCLSQRRRRRDSGQQTPGRKGTNAGRVFCLFFGKSC